MAKILMLLDNPLRSDARVEKEATALIFAGYEVTIFATKDSTLRVIENRDGYTIHRIIEHSFTRPFGKQYQNFLKQTVSQICLHDFDILHCHDFYMLNLGVQAKKKKPEIKLIYDAHEFLVGWPFYWDSKGWMNKLKGFFVWKKLIANEKNDVRYIDSMLTITDAIAEEFCRTYRLPKKPLVIGNYPNIGESVNHSENLKTSLFIPKEDTVLIHTGSIYHTNQELELLFDIVQRNSKIHLVFVGNRPRFEEIKQFVFNQELSRIYFLDYPKDQTEVIQLLSGADIGLLHIRQTWRAHQLGFSNRFVEYVQAGLAVVATPQEFTRAVNHKYPCCVFYSISDKESLEVAILEAIKQLDKLKQNSEKAKVKLTWHSEKEKFINFYKEIQ